MSDELFYMLIGAVAGAVVTMLGYAFYRMRENYLAEKQVKELLEHWMREESS